MNPLNRLSIQSKLILMLLAVSILSTLVIAVLAYRNGSESIRTASLNQLTSLRTTRASRIESHMRLVQNQVRSYSASLEVINAMKAFKGALYFLDEKVTASNPDQLAGLQTFYNGEVRTNLAAIFPEGKAIDALLPQTPVAQYLQFYYSTVGKDWNERIMVDDPGDQSVYSAIHRRYHPILRQFVQNFNYEDLFLVDIVKHEVVYTAFKGIDFLTDLKAGPYATSGLGQVVQQAINTHMGGVVVQDFELYLPSYNTPQAFVASPIYEGPTMIGVLVLQVSKDEIDQVMTGNRNWAADGLGQTGETYLVGPDHRMRSNSRFLLEAPESYFAAMRAIGTAAETLHDIEANASSVLHHEVHTEQVNAALNGQAGTLMANDYRNVPVLASYAPLEIPGLRWVIVAEMDQAEAFAPVQRFNRTVLISTVLMIVLVTLLAMLLSTLFVKPIRLLVGGAKQIADGDLSAKVELGTHDEFNDLANAFNHMAESLRQKAAQIVKKDAENDALLGNILPAPIAKRYKSGETSFAEDIPNVTIVYADLGGIVPLTSKLGAEDVGKIFNELVASFDDAAERLGVEKVKTSGSAYLAASGLSVPRLDHAQRAANFAHEMMRLVQRYNHEHSLALTLHVGINTGPVSAGIIGQKRFIYDLWGDTVSIAVRVGSESKVSPTGKDGNILVTQPIFERLQQSYPFEANGKVQAGGRGELSTWVLKNKEEHKEDTPTTGQVTP